MKMISIKGHSIPTLGFGTWRLFGDDCTRAVKFAIAEGYTHIDTAQIYENEEEVGAAIKDSGAARDKIFLTTKIWRNQFSGGTAVASMDESLKKLKTDYVDLLLVHWPFPECNLEGMIEDVVKIHRAGKARLIGVSNFTSQQMDIATRVSGGLIANNQVEYHPYLSQKPVLESAHKHGMFVTAYSPIARGKVFQDTVLKEIGMKYGKNPGQITLRWLVQQDNVAAIPKSATPDNIKSNLDIFDFELSDQDMKDIHNLASPQGRLVNPEFAPKWDAAA